MPIWWRRYWRARSGLPSSDAPARKRWATSAAAVRAVRLIANRIERIPAQPRLGERLPRFVPREVRRVLAAKYKIRYELTESDVVVLRILHAREDR